MTGKWKSTSNGIGLKTLLPALYAYQLYIKPTVYDCLSILASQKLIKFKLSIFNVVFVETMNQNFHSIMIAACQTFIEHMKLYIMLYMCYVHVHEV